MLPAQRHRGGARALMRQSMERCLRQGANVMFLEVAVDNLPAQRLYGEMGFEQVGSRPDYYQRGDGARVGAHTMRCDLVQACGVLAPSA